MAGWSMVADNSTVDGYKIARKLDPNQLSDDLEVNSNGSIPEADDSTVDGYKTARKLDPNQLSDDLKLHSNGSIPEEKAEQPVLVFERVLNCFVSEFSSSGSFLILPPRVGNGKPVDLFKLFLDVSEKGGFDAVTKNGLWKIVAQESGFKLNMAASLKLIYVKYLDKFGRLLDLVVENETGSGLELSGLSMELEAELQSFLSEMRKSYKDELSGKVFESKVVLKHFLCETKKRYYDCHHVRELPGSDMKNLFNFGRWRDVSRCLIDEDLEISETDSEEKPSVRKRKRKSMWEILNWVVKVAKNPGDPENGTLPERSKWTSYGNDETWKQILLLRAAVSHRSHMDSFAEKYWQNHQKMHPCMYDDGTGSGYNLRERLISPDGQISGKIVAKFEFTSGIDSSDSDFDRQYVRIGSKFQVQVLEWTNVDSESDSKWLGTRVWPLDRDQNNRLLLIERDPIGKGRRDSCACQEFGSVECSRFHISEKVEKLKLELGMAFHKWKFYEMGEKVAASWSILEQKKVNALMKTPPNLHNTFLEQIHKILPSKTRFDIVSYFYNVVLLRHRAKQNRSTPCNVDSDEEEPEDTESATEDFNVTPQMSKSPKSILLTPKKQNKRV